MRKSKKKAFPEQSQSIDIPRAVKDSRDVHGPIGPFWGPWSSKEAGTITTT